MLVSHSNAVASFGDTDRRPKVHVHVGDALDVLRSMPSDSVHCCMTSPPYWGLRNYEGDPGMIGMEDTFQDHVENLLKIFDEVHRVLRPDSTFWVNYGDAYAGSGRGGNPDDNPFRKQATNAGSLVAPKGLSGFKPKDLMLMGARIAIALQDRGWWLRSEIVWHKRSMFENVKDRPTTTHEKVFLFSKTPQYYYDWLAVRQPSVDPKMREQGVTSHMRNVWRINAQGFHGSHFAVFPEALVEPVVMAGTSEHGVCTACGAPWERAVRKTGGPPGGDNRKHLSRNQDRAMARRMGQGYDSAGNKIAQLRGVLDGAAYSEVYRKYGFPRFDTEGWRPTCDCNAHRTQAVILDPFAGAGTTGLVAARYGRSARLIEISPRYADVMAWRIQDATEADVRIHAP